MDTLPFVLYQSPAARERVTACGVPFTVERRGGTVRALPDGEAAFAGRFRTLFFLGMSTQDPCCCEWWGQAETLYDASPRLFFGDRVGRIRLVFADRTEELISVIFGVNAMPYEQLFRPLPHEDASMSFGAPYAEPFLSDPAARALLTDALWMTKNDDPAAEKATRWVFAYRPADKPVVRICWEKEDSKRAGFVLSGITGIPAGQDDRTGLPAADRARFLRKDWYAPIEALRRRVYQYADEVPRCAPLVDVPGFDAPDIRFYRADGLHPFTNVYRINAMDMAHGKVTDDGMPHTSSGGTDFGHYTGCGTFARNETYAAQVWSRDVGRLLTELCCLGYTDRVRMAVDRLHGMLYLPSLRFPVPHWKRMANVTARNDADLYNEGNENDGHAALMLAVYTLYRKGGTDKAWLEKNRRHLRAAADYFLWQAEHPELSGFDRILYSHSEASTQRAGGFDLFSNVMALTALRMYARLFDVLDDPAYAGRLRALAGTLSRGVRELFLLRSPRHGAVWTDTTDDCWTYEYKRFCALLIAADVGTLDAARADPALFDEMSRTMAVQTESYYSPFSGRQMGYGQGYLTTAMLMLDRPRDYSACIEAATALCYHHTDLPYLVPEGVVRHGSGAYWFRSGDLGNAVQQAEIVKLARLMAGADDLSGTDLCLTPRLPDGMTAIEVRDLPVTVRGSTCRIGYRYARGTEGDVFAADGSGGFCLSYAGQIRPRHVRFGPFSSPEVRTNGRLLYVSPIGGAYYAYVAI